MKLAVIFPSRGTAFSKTIEELYRELLPLSIEWEVFFAHSLPIPTCFNQPTQRALDAGCSHFWYVEDDMVLPRGILQELIELDVPIAVADAPVTFGPDAVGGTLFDRHGLPIASGTGCALIRRQVIETVGAFSTDTSYIMSSLNGVITFTPHTLSPTEQLSSYGGHDIDFYLRAHRAGYHLNLTKSTCGQRRITRYGKDKQNSQGWHDIETQLTFRPSVLNGAFSG